MGQFLRIFGSDDLVSISYKNGLYNDYDILKVKTLRTESTRFAQPSLYNAFVSSLWPTLDGKINTSKKTDRARWTENLVQKKF